LHAAVRALRADERLVGLTHTQVLAALVLMAKSNYRTGEARTTARELGRWLGVTESSVDHDVFPALVAAQAVETEVVTAASGRVEGVVCRVLPLREARGSYGAPLALTKREFAVLLRLVEALFAPGWAGSDTEPGLLAGRREKGASTDRLALLLLVLQCREDGTVPLVGGTVAAGRGRGAATLAQLLGCSVSGASKVLGRLRQWDVVETPVRPTRSGLRGKQLLVVSGVAAVSAARKASRSIVPPKASVQEPPSTAAEPYTGCACTEVAGEGVERPVLAGEGWRQESLEDLLAERPDTALGDLDSLGAAKRPGQQPKDENDHGVVSESSGLPAAASLHAEHPEVADVGDEGTGDCGFSGSAVGGGGGLPERVCVREEASGSSTAPVGGVSGGPLRGEKRDQLGSDGATGSCGRWVFGGRASEPQDLGKALAPVAGLWAQVGRSSTRMWLAGRVRGEVGRLRGLVDPQLAQRVLADRLERRLRDQRQPVRDVVAWLVKVGLPQRAGCWSTLCDEGIRLDTRGACESCQVLIGDRRGLRRAVAERVLEDRLSGRLVLPQGEVGREVERRLQEAVREELVRKAAARERAVVEQAVREASYEIKRQRFAEAERARAAAPCADCGVPEASGLCLGCTERRGVEAAVEDAVAFALVLRFEPADAAGARALWQDCERATRAALEERLVQLREQGVDELALSWNGRRLMEELRDRRRRAAIVRLGQQEDAEQAARMAAAALRRKQLQPATAEAREAARAAGEEARARVAERWLSELLAELRSLLSLGSARADELTDWSAVLPALASQPLPVDTAGGVRERVGA
jgi:hypothetical protein